MPTRFRDRAPVSQVVKPLPQGLASKLMVLLVLSVLALLSVPQAVGQTESATLSGVIQDPHGAVVTGVEVTATRIETGISASTTTNNAGIYFFTALPPGHYHLLVQKPGFKEIAIKEFQLNVQDKSEQNFTLEIGSVSETITVEAGALSVNTQDASVSTVVDRQFVENLPLNGRSFQSLLYITPGVSLNAGPGLSREGTQGQFVVNGQRAASNYWMVDGVSANVGVSNGVPGIGASGSVGATNALGGTSALVSVDELQEFRIETSSYAPEFGRETGGQISIQTRSGTNQFHGTAFEYLRNTVLDATDWFASHNGLQKAAEIQNDFGGVIGGPIKKDKTFFFFSYEGLRLIQPYTELATVPDLAARAAADPAMQPYFNMYPLPVPGAVDAAPGIAPYTATFSNPAATNVYSLRIDHQLTNSVKLFARYHHAPSTFTQRGAPGEAANAITFNNVVTKMATVGATWMASSQVVNDARFNYSVSGGRVSAAMDDFGGGTAMPSSTQSLLASPLTYQNATFAILPLFGSNMEVVQGFGSANFQHQYNVVDSLSMQRGAHSLKFGVDYRRLSPSYQEATEALVPLFGSIDDMEAGNANPLLEFHSASGTLVLRNLGLYGQDTWRVNSRLNLTYGLRWDVDFYPTAESGPNLARAIGFSRTDLSNLAVDPAGGPAYSTHYGNIAPRVGGAYRISTSADWGLVLRGGFGVFYGLSSTQVLNANIGGAYYPFGAYAILANFQFPAIPTNGVLPPVEAPNATNGYDFLAYDPNLNQPYALEWNAALEQSLGRAQTLSLSYIGASDKRELGDAFIYNPNPNLAAVSMLTNLNTSNYQALQAKFQRQMTDGLQMLLSYTWSHSIDDGSLASYTNGDFAHVHENRGDSDYDLRNVFTAAVTYNVPAWKRNLLTKGLTGGWSLDNIVQIRSGPPVSLQDSNFSFISGARAGEFLTIRPDVVPGQPFYLSGSQYPGGKALNPAAFTDPPLDPSTGNPLRQGNLRRNMLRALGLTQWDFAVHREFPIHERLKLEFRAELFNILNHPNFGPFNSAFQNGNIYFGQSTSMLNQYLGGSAGTGSQNALYTPGGPRSGELALKLIF